LSFSTSNVQRESVWLVKSGDRISGPFTTPEITEKIKNKEIAVIDEVTSPQTRWRYVRDEPLFEAAVEEIRSGLMHGLENTEVQGYTQTPGESDSFEVTSAEIPISNVEELDIKDAEFSEAARGDREDRKTREMHGRLDFRRVGVVALIACVVIGIIVYLNNLSHHAPDDATHTMNVDISKMISQAQRAWDRGEFDQALKTYREIQAASPNRPDVLGRLAVLILKFDQSTVEAKRLLESVNLDAADDRIKSEISLARGLLSMASDEWQEADTFFAEVNDDSHAWVAQFNRGMVAFHKRDFTGAASYFRANHGVSQFMLARTLLLNGSRQARKDSEESIQALATKYFDFRQEALVLGAASTFDASRKVAASRVKAALDIDPFQTRDHFHDPFLAIESNVWKSLMGSCRKASDELKTPSARALLALCLFQADDSENALKQIASELAHSPDDLSLQSMSAFLDFSSSREENSRATLKMIGKQESRLAQLVTARDCVKRKDRACAEQAWSRLASEAPPMLAALTGLAEVRLQSADREGGGALLVKADSLSPQYLPLIRMRQDLGSR
jgi:tetratricopeptide (TPR) repeat protein